MGQCCATYSGLRKKVDRMFSSLCFVFALKKEDRLETDEEFLFLKKKKMLVFVNFEQSKNYLKCVVL